MGKDITIDLRLKRKLKKNLTDVYFQLDTPREQNAQFQNTFAINPFYCKKTLSNFIEKEVPIGKRKSCY